MNRSPKTGLRQVFIRELKWILKEPSFVLMTIVLPVIVFLLFIGIFSQGVPKNIPVGIYDADGSPFSRELVRRLSSVPSISIKYRVTSLEEGRELILGGKIFSFIYIQKDFEKKIERGFPSEVIHYYNNENQLTGGTLFRDVTSTVKEMSSERLRENLLKKGTPKSKTDTIVEPIKVNSHVLFNPYTNYMYYLVSGLLPTMLQFFIILCTIYSIGIELKKGTIKEAMEIGRMNVVTVITGKLLPYTFIFSLMGIFMLTLMFGYLRFPLQGNIYLLIGATFLFVLCYQAVGLFFIGVTGRLLQGMTIASFYASSAFTYTGMTFPYISMYQPAKIWAQFLPLTHYLRILIEQAFRNAPVSVTAKSFFILTLFLFIPFAVLPKFKKLFTDESRWGDWGSL